MQGLNQNHKYAAKQNEDDRFIQLMIISLLHRCALNASLCLYTSCLYIRVQYWLMCYSKHSEHWCFAYFMRYKCKNNYINDLNIWGILLSLINYWPQMFCQYGNIHVKQVNNRTKLNPMVSFNTTQQPSLLTAHA